MAKKTRSLKVSDSTEQPRPTGPRQSSKPIYEVALHTDKATEIRPTVDFEVLKALTEKSILNPDFSQAVRNAQNTANTAYLVDFVYTTEMSEEAQMEMQDKALAELRRFDQQMYPGANCFTFRNDLVASIQRNGAACVEWVPSTNLSNGIEKAVIVPAHTCRWFRSPRGNLELRQKVPYTLTTLGEKRKFEEYVTLSPMTAIYRAIALDDGNPYGTPPNISVLKPLLTQERIMDGVQAYSKKINPMGFVSLKFRKPSKLQSETADSYVARCQRLLSEMFDFYKDGFQHGLAVSFMDESEVEHFSTIEGGQNVYQINQLNEEQVFSALNQDPALGGRTYSTTETYAGVVYDKYLNGMMAVQTILSDILSKGYLLHLQLKGFPIKEVVLSFTKAKSLTNKTDAEADYYRQKTQHELYSDGIISQNQYAGNMGYPKPDMADPRYPYVADIEAQAEMDSELKPKENPNGERQTRGGKEVGATKKEPRKKR